MWKRFTLDVKERMETKQKIIAEIKGYNNLIIIVIIINNNNYIQIINIK